MDNSADQPTAGKPHASRLGIVSVGVAIASGCCVCLWFGIYALPGYFEGFGLPYGVFESFRYGLVARFGEIAATVGCLLVPVGLILGAVSFARSGSQRAVSIAAIVIALLAGAMSLILFLIRFLFAMQ
jgi:hypothetical protein